jgi:hypothetical protein
LRTCGPAIRGFDQSPGVRASQRVRNNTTDRQSRAHKQPVRADFERQQLPHPGQVNQRVNGCMPPLFEIDQQIRAAGDRRERARGMSQGVQRLGQGFRTEIILPEGHVIKYLNRQGAQNAKAN